MTNEITKDDINRIYDKLEPLAEGVVRIETKLDIHLESHKDVVNFWGKPLIRNALDLVRLAVVAIVAYLFARK